MEASELVSLEHFVTGTVKEESDTSMGRPHDFSDVLQPHSLQGRDPFTMSFLHCTCRTAEGDVATVPHCYPG